MGRYAQRRRRGGAGATGAAPAPPVTITSVSNNLGTGVNVFFSGPVTLDTGVTPDSGFNISGTPPLSVSPGTPSDCQLDFGGGISSGNPWTLGGQPNWLLTPVSWPDAGSVT